MSLFSFRTKNEVPGIAPFTLPNTSDGNLYSILVASAYKAGQPFLNLITDNSRPIYFKKAVMLEVFCYLMVVAEDFAEKNYNNKIDLVNVYREYLDNHLDDVLRQHIKAVFKSVNTFLKEKRKFYKYEHYCFRTFNKANYRALHLRLQLLECPLNDSHLSGAVLKEIFDEQLVARNDETFLVIHNSVIENFTNVLNDESAKFKYIVA